LATKRHEAEAKRWHELWKKHSLEKKRSQNSILSDVLFDLGWIDEPIFMAEPRYVGYKRRKNLPDLPMPNQLYAEDKNARVDPESELMKETVLGRWQSGAEKSTSPVLGFWTTLRKVVERPSFRLDPKYRWLWDFQHGTAHGDPDKGIKLGKVLNLVHLPKIPKGELDEESRLIDLEHVESRQALISDDAPLVDVLGSDRVKFEGCDLVISKLEPYLAKIIIDPPSDAVGSPEWIGLKITTDIPKNVLAYVLMLPDLCEAYRRLQSGKRHARFDPKEFLQLKVQLPPKDYFLDLNANITKKRKEILELRQQVKKARISIDELFGAAGVEELPKNAKDKPIQ
jgi:hypothetical protein